MSSTKHRSGVRPTQISSVSSRLAMSTSGVRGHVVSRRSLALLALGALAVATTLALMMALGGSSGSTQAVAPTSAAVAQPDSRPSESAVAAAVGLPTAGIAASSAPVARPDGGPSESTVAASVGVARTGGAGRSDGGPDESRTAAAIGTR